MSFHPDSNLPSCMLPDGGECCAGHAALCEDWHRQRRELEGLRSAGETKHHFYGAECSSYPNCNGGCGLGCTKEHVGSTTPSKMTPLARIDLICEQEELYTREEIITAIRRIVAEGSASVAQRPAERDRIAKAIYASWLDADHCTENHFQWFDAGKENPDSCVHYSNVAKAYKAADRVLAAAPQPASNAYTAPMPITDEMAMAGAKAMILLGRDHRVRGVDLPTRIEEARACLEAAYAVPSTEGNSRG